MRILLGLFFFSILHPAVCHSFDMLSITPFELFPGTEITLRGTEFPENLIAVLGESEIKPASVDSRVIRLVIPEDTEPGIYKLFLKAGDSKTAPLMISVRKREIQILSHAPESIDLCGGEKEISIAGDNLTEVRRINVNGREVHDYTATKTSIVIPVNDSFFKPGITSLNVYLFDERRRISSIVNVNVNTAPVIEQIEPLNSSVTYYSLRISGRNFVSDMRLFANNAMIIQSPGNNPAIFGNENLVTARRLFSGSPASDRFEFVGCNELVYFRYPLSSENRQVIIHAESPGGEKSNSFILATP